MYISKGFSLGTIFWGTLLILWGASLLLNALFGINIPVIRLFLGGLLIYAGFSVMSFGRTQESFQSYWFSHHTLSTKHLQNEVRVSFSNSIIDLRTISAFRNSPVTIKAFCSNVRLITDPDIATKVIVNSTFSRTVFLNKEVTTSGVSEFIINPNGHPIGQELFITLMSSNLEIE